jgi:hypothetical protein
MVIVLQFPLCLYELQWSVVCVDDRFLSHLFVISGILLNCVGKCLIVICHWMHMLSKDYPNSIVRGIYLDLKWLLQAW